MNWRSMFAVVVMCAATAVQANPHLDAIDGLPPGEQYRQLSLMLMVCAGVPDGLVDALQEIETAPGTKVLSPGELATPLARIVDQRTLLAASAGLFGFAREHGAEVRARLDAIEAANPLLVSRVHPAAIAEDAIVIRSALADTMAFSGFLPGEPAQAWVEEYRVHTLYLRNAMEYTVFEADLQRLTDEAIASVGGQLDAYQRMFEDETASRTFERHIEAAESRYTRPEGFDRKAAELTEEMVEAWVLSESQPHR